jgi:hypothetical protein
MMADIVNFTQPDRLIWVCDCGCSTFSLFSDGVAECSLCAAPVTGAAEGWQEATEEAGKRDEPIARTSDHQGNGSAEFAKALIRKTAADPDLKLCITATGDSRTRVWAEAENTGQMEWTMDRIQDAIGLLKKWPLNET